MKSEKQRITKLISSVEEKIRDGNDIYDFAGISRQIIVKSLNDTYKLLTLLEKYDNELEVIWYKRRFTDIIDDLFSILKEVDSKDWKNKFNKFLTNISDLKFRTKELYIIVGKDPIRTDLEIADIKQKYDDIKNKFENLSEMISNIEESSEALDLFKSESENQVAEISKKLQSINNMQSKNQELTENIDKAYSDVQEKQSEIKAKAILLSENIELSKVLIENNERTEKYIQTNKKDIDQMTQNLSRQIAIDNEIQDKLKQTLEDINKFGLASAFQKRKRELRTSVVLWGSLTIIALSVLVFLSYEYAKDITSSIALSNPFLYLIKLPTIIATVWLGWFCSKQFGFTIRIREDYSYKSAISMAFEGYKKEAKDINPALLEQLIKVTILNISLNPVTIFDTKNNHGSPMHEFSESIKQFLKIEAKINTPGL